MEIDPVTLSLGVEHSVEEKNLGHGEAEGMEYLVDPSDVKEDECETMEIDPGLLLTKGHISWLFRFVYSVSANPADQPIIFCVNCSRYLEPREQATSHSSQHQPLGGEHHLYPPILVQRRSNGTGEVDYYVSVQALKEVQVPIGDVLSHLLPDPLPWLIQMSGGPGNNLARCLYLHPRNSKEEMWQGEMLSGRCAYRDCEKIFNNRQSHLRLYGITPQFCSISCKVESAWLCCNTSCND